MEFLLDPGIWVSLLTLIILEIVLGIDNVIFVSIILNRISKNLQKKARIMWIIAGIIFRCSLLLALQWLLDQKGKAIFTIYEKPFDLASLVMLAGGLFLMYKSVKEIHHKVEGEEDATKQNNKPLSFTNAIFQIMIIDIVFSFDSIITAGGTAKHIEIMIAAVVIAMVIMFIFSTNIANFIQQHPTIKMLALSFLVMIGLSLIIEGWNPVAAHDLHLKNYIYFAMAFSFAVELLNMRMRKKVKL